MHSGKHIHDASTLDGWHKSSHSGGGNGNCLEITRTSPALTPVRDSKNPTGPALVFTADAWTAFTGAVKRRTA